MANQKIENLLNLALTLPRSLRRRSPTLSAADTDGIWEIIIRTDRDISYLSQTHPQITVTSLYEGYAILQLPPELIAYVASLPEVIYIEMPKYLFFQTLQGRQASCIPPVTQPPLSLSGENVLIGIVDSGIDVSHPDFRDDDGNTRILRLWDQNPSPGPAPSGYHTGTEYTREQLNTALQSGGPLPADPSGHGTAVAGIACGNGRASGGRSRGVAPKASLIAVKMKAQNPYGSPRTSELISAVNYCIEKSLELNMPLVINLSFGNNYGSHTGSSLTETYLNQVSAIGRICIVVASGNEGYYPIHASGKLSSSTQNIEFSVGAREPALNLQLWKDYADDIEITLVTPSGRLLTVSGTAGLTLLLAEDVQIAVYYGEPLPYLRLQEIYFDFIPSGDYLPSGIWQLSLSPIRIRNGGYQLWLPGGSAVGRSTRFLDPDPENTLTIPSTSPGVITAGAYDSARNEPADFSGRGRSGMPALLTKPDLVAPGINIEAPASPATYQSFTGTSFAAPFVSGSAALLMEWGIVRGNDPFLYGEKLKAFLINGARQLAGFPSPNSRTGWGALCVEDSIPAG